ncbi:hypothetical protein FRC00_011871, partial [Tulasnella sp. 408]
SKEGLYTEYDAAWNCGSVWGETFLKTLAGGPGTLTLSEDNIPFRSGLYMMDTIPPISVEWNSSSHLSGPDQTFLSGLSAILTSNPDMLSMSSTDLTDNPNDTPIPGITFMLTAGRMIRIEVGRRQIYSRKANFGELLGFSQPPDIYLTYPT